MRYYLFIIGILYTIGAALHLLDVFDLRLQFSAMATAWKTWIVFLLVADSMAALGLLTNKKYGEYFFLTVAAAQLIAYIGFMDIFGKQFFLISFHIVTLSLYFFLKLNLRGKK